MKKHYYILIILLAAISCNYRPNTTTANYKTLVSDSLICTTLNYFVNDTSINEFKECNRFSDKDCRKVLFQEDSVAILRLDSIFTKEDFDFIFKQNLNSNNYKQGQCLKGKILIPGDTLLKFYHLEFWDEFKKKYGKGGFCTISLPLFSKDKNIVIIKYSYSRGRLNASGGTFIYKKVGNGWTKLYCLDYWIS
jgi:hypothetical protein